LFGDWWATGKERQEEEMMDKKELSSLTMFVHILLQSNNTEKKKQAIPMLGSGSQEYMRCLEMLYVACDNNMSHKEVIKVFGSIEDECSKTIADITEWNFGCIKREQDRISNGNY
jgi:hypothetical protein